MNHPAQILGSGLVLAALIVVPYARKRSVVRRLLCPRSLLHALLIDGAVALWTAALIVSVATLHASLGGLDLSRVRWGGGTVRAVFVMGAAILPFVTAMLMVAQGPVLLFRHASRRFARERGLKHDAFPDPWRFPGDPPVDIPLEDRVQLASDRFVGWRPCSRPDDLGPRASPSSIEPSQCSRRLMRPRVPCWSATHR